MNTMNFKSERKSKIEEITDNINKNGDVVTVEQVAFWIGGDATDSDIDAYLYGTSVEDGDEENCEPLMPKDADDIVSLWQESQDEENANV